MDAVWERTQDPVLHQRWDVRFGHIEYLPREGGEPQRFTYGTRVAPGVDITGTGEALGDRDRADGSRWSGLKFWSKDRRSIISSGAGYWRYIPTDDGVRFLTGYDYRTRWGRFGGAVDRRVFRPLFGWATAWSFDRLRLWVERGIEPERSRNQAVAHAAAVSALAGTWIYHGVVPKLLFADVDERRLMYRSGFSGDEGKVVIRAAGAAEAAFGVATALSARKRWPFVANLIVLPALAAGIWRNDKRMFAKPFNPVSLNGSLMALAVVALVTRHDLPSGRTPLRSPPDEQPDVDLSTQDDDE